MCLKTPTNPNTRNNHTRLHSTPAHNWIDYPDLVISFTSRLQGVVIENQPAINIIRQFDTDKTLFYVDPPYPDVTRNNRWAGNAYRFEMSENDHKELASILNQVKGMVIISGYPCELYDELYKKWQRLERQAWADRALSRTEVLWISPNVQACTSQKTLF